MEAKMLTSPSAESTRTVAAIERDAHVAVKDCYQCGKCSAGCPVAPMADMTPREVIRNLQLGLAEPVLKSNMPWMCASCGMCLARCPQCVDLPNLMAACRRAAKDAGNVPIKEVERFGDIFIDNVRMKGVSDEALLAMRFNMTTGHLFQDVLGAPKMVTRGMLNASGHEVENAAEVRELIDRTRALTQSERAADAALAEAEAAANAPAPASDPNFVPTTVDKTGGAR